MSQRHTMQGNAANTGTALVWKRFKLLSYEILKRCIDICAAIIVAVLLSYVLILVAIAIKLDSPGPILFKQRRVGQMGRCFDMWKFRSMRQDAEAIKEQLMKDNEMDGGVLFKMRDDPRVTRVGRFIRKYSIDELPQLWNVLIGDLSLVGPRPALPSEVKEYSFYQQQRLAVKPGITCIWQVSGRSNIPFAGQVDMDIRYIRKRHIVKDVWLLLKTIPAVVTGKGAC